MADSYAEDIVSAVLAAVTGLTTTGDNAFRGRVYEIPETSLPCVCVYQSGDFPLTNTSPWKFIDSELSIVVEAVVKDSSVQAETTLNQIRFEVAQFLQRDVTLGLSFVMNTTEGSASITLDGSTNEIVGRMRMEWVVLYRRVRDTFPQTSITAIGSGLNYPSISSPEGMAGLTSTSFAYLDPGVGQIRRYTVNTGTGAFTYSAQTTRANNKCDLTPTADDQLGVYYYLNSGTQSLIRRTSWSGAAWSDSGGSTSVGGSSAKVCKVATDVLVASTSAGGGVYSYAAGSYSLVASETPGTDGGPRPMAYRSDNLVAVLSPSGPHYHLRDWTWNGSTWSHSGNQLLVEVSGITQIIPMRSGTRLVAYSPTAHIAVVFDKIGASWFEIGRASVGSQSATLGTICGLAGTDYFVQVDATNKTFMLYHVEDI